MAAERLRLMLLDEFAFAKSAIGAWLYSVLLRSLPAGKDASATG